MKTKIIGLLLILCACGRSPADFSEDAVIITDIEKYYEEGCMYFTRTTKRYDVNRILQRGYFYDKCGKFTVGDTVKIVKR